MIRRLPRLHRPSGTNNTQTARDPQSAHLHRPTQTARATSTARATFRAQSRARRLTVASICLGIGLLFSLLTNVAGAQVAPVTPPEGSAPGSLPSTTAIGTTPVANAPSGPQGPAGAQGPEATQGDTNASISLNVGEALSKPSQSITIIVLLTILSLAPSMLIMTTSFTRIVVVLALVRNALGLPSVPPNQVLIGLAMFLTFFVMAPTFNAMHTQGIAPMLDGQLSQKDGLVAATQPLKSFMLANTRQEELALFVEASKTKPENPESVSLVALIPAFIISELKTAFIVGFVIFIPFLVIDIVISSVLMSMGMMMLPPQMISLPFKLLLFVLVDGWSLLAKSLLQSFN